MKAVNILFLFLISCVCSSFMRAQDNISIGIRRSLFSQHLNEERNYWIYIPEKQPGESDKAYPVLYLLDGDSFFHSVVGFTRFFASLRVSSLPPCVVVALLNTDRTRDFTPTSSAARRDGTIHPEDKPEGGGAELFYRFIVEELRPAIKKDLPLNEQNFLVGHSYAGLFTLYTLLNHPDAFDTYIAIDPSLWWDKGCYLKQAEHKTPQINFSGKQLYIGFATQPRPDKKLIHFSLIDEFFEKVVPVMEKQQLRVISKEFPEEMHGTVALPGIYDGLKRLFSNYATSFSYISRYNKVSAKCTKQQD